MIDENCMTILGCYVILSQDLNANYIVSKTELGLALGIGKTDYWRHLKQYKPGIRCTWYDLCQRGRQRLWNRNKTEWRCCIISQV